MTSGVMPVPVSLTASITYWPGVDFAVERGIGVVEKGIGDFQGQLAAVRHGVARVDGEIEDGVLDLVGIGQRVPQPARDRRFRPRSARPGSGAACRSCRG